MEARFTTDPPGGELRFGRRRDPHRPGEVHGDDVREHLRIVLGVAPDHAGRVHEDVDLRQPAERRLDRGGVPHVEDLEIDTAIGAILRGSGALRLGGAGRRDRGSEVPEGAGAAEPDPARPAGHEHGAAAE
jgi:hypothetical protein